MCNCGKNTPAGRTVPTEVRPPSTHPCYCQPTEGFVAVPDRGAWLVTDGVAVRVRVIDQGETLILAQRDNLYRDPMGCPYTHAHTRHWCGYEGCRES